MSFSLPERVTLKGPNFIREVFERGVGVEGFISFGIGNPAPEAIPVEVIEKAFDEVVHSNPMSLFTIWTNARGCTFSRIDIRASCTNT